MERIHFNEAIETEKQAQPIDMPNVLQTDMVELLTLVVDDLCVQIGEIKEQIDDKSQK